MTQLLSNPGAEVDTAGWSGSGGALARVTTPVRTGAGAFRITADGGTNANILGSLLTGLTPGQQVTVTGWVRSAAAIRQAVLQVEWSSDSVGYIAGNASSQVATSSSAWTQVPAVTFTVPANATRALFYPQVISPSAGEVFYWDDLSFDAAAVTPQPTVLASGPARTVWKDPIALSASGMNFTSLSWTVVAAPAGSTAILSNASTASPTFVPSKPGAHTFRVTATGPGGTATSDVNVDVRRQLIRYTAGGSVPVRLLRYP